MKVFLKFNRSDAHSIICLHQWMEIFKNYEMIVVCDLYNVDKEQQPQFLKNLAIDYTFSVINTDYSSGNFLPFKAKKKKMASANITCWQHLSKKDKCFWIIDADDTMFLSFQYDIIRDKLKKAEDTLLSENLNAYSLDFYREYNNAWTFGVCCVNANTDVSKISLVTNEEITNNNLPINFDSVFDVLGRNGVYKLKSFVLNECGFQHLINNFPKLAGGIYYWQNRKLWDIPLLNEVDEI